MQALAPITVTVGQDSTLDPSQTKQPIKAVILFNASPVVVKVSGGGQDFYLQPNSTQTMPASTPLGNIVLAGVSSISSSSNSGSVYPTLIWTNDVMPGSPSASPVTDINVTGGSLNVTSGSVTINGGTVTVGGDQATLATVSNFSDQSFASGPLAVQWTVDAVAPATIQGVRWDQGGSILVTTPGVVAGTYSLETIVQDSYHAYIYSHVYSEVILTASSTTQITFYYPSENYITPVAYTGYDLEFVFLLRGASFPPGTYSLQGQPFNFTGLPIGYGLDSSSRSNYGGIPLADSVAPADTLLVQVQSTAATQIYSVPLYGNGIIVRSLAALTDNCGISNAAANPFVYCPAGDTRGCNFYIPPGGGLWMVNGGSSGYIFVSYTTL